MNNATAYPENSETSSHSHNIAELRDLIYVYGQFINYLKAAPHQNFEDIARLKKDKYEAETRLKELSEKNNVSVYPEYYHSSYPENYFRFSATHNYPEYDSYGYPEYSYSGNYPEYSTYPEYNFGYPEATHVLPEYWEKPYGESTVRNDYPEDTETAGCNWCLKIVSTLTQQLMKKEAAFESLKNTCDAKAHAKRQKQEAVDLVNVITAYNKYIKNLEDSMASENDVVEKRAIMNKLGAFYQYRAEAQAQLNELL